MVDEFLLVKNITMSTGRQLQDKRIGAIEIKRKQVGSLDPRSLTRLGVISQLE
jgi:hypothetical protein